MVDRLPIFVVGAPRCGTTLLKDVLNQHSQVHLFNEVHFFERIWDDRTRLGSLTDESELERAATTLREMMSQHGTDAEVVASLPIGTFTERAIAAGGSYRGLLKALLTTASELHGASHWGDSSPQDVLYLPTLFEWYADARVIAMVRDPRAFMASYKNYYRRETESYKERYNPLTVALLWRSYMSAARDSQSAQFAERVRIQRYEDLVAEPDSNVAAIAKHIGIDYEQGMLEVPRANSSYAPGDGGTGIFSSSTDRWREELSPTEQWLTERICGSTMEHFGYRTEMTDRSLPPSPIEFSRIVSIVPGRLFNMLFRGRKEFRIEKVRRVLSSLRGRGAQ